MNIKKFILFIIIVLVVVVLIVVGLKMKDNITKSKPEDVFNQYMSYLVNAQYEQMYDLLDENTRNNTSLDVFVSRNKNIYSGIQARNIQITNVNVEEDEEAGKAKITYYMSIDTLAGKVAFQNEVLLTRNIEEIYKMAWSSSLIFPYLDDTERVRVGTTQAKRGSIYDRNNVLLAGEGTVSSVGIVPGKLGEKKDKDIKKIAELLDLTEEKINSELNASYVATDTFVPIAKVSKENYDLKEKLLAISGIMITDAPARIYPYGEELSHLIGYVQTVSAEDLQNNEGKGYTENSVIGKSGLEKIYEDRLRGKNGSEIYITDSQGNRNQTVAKIDVVNGENVKLTIDARIQKYVYDEFKNDKSACVIMNHKTGEIIAMCSTPTYNSNDFILGMSTNKWNSLTNDKNKPLYNRYSASYAPGSSFKPIIGAIGLTNNSFGKDDDFGKSGTSWQKDSSWGTYNVTTLSTYDTPANLANALIYSDNIYFAKAALKIGKEKLASSLDKIGFGKSIPLEQAMTSSSYSDNGTFDSEIQLADSGYGQGKVLVNPVHVASIYSAFINKGNMIKPYIEYKENTVLEYYVINAFAEEAANTIKEDLIQVVENANGTAHSAKIDGVTIAGKTGTAEIKTSKKDETGTEIGWFNAFTTDENSNNQFLIISMVEDVKDRGGSHYLLPKVKSILQKIV